MTDELPDGSAIICLDWSDPPILPGSGMNKCGFCQRALQVSPEGQQLIREKSAVPVCTACTAENAGEDQMSVPYGPIMERVEKELGAESEAVRMHRETPVKDLAKIVERNQRGRN